MCFAEATQQLTNASAQFLDTQANLNMGHNRLEKLCACIASPYKPPATTLISQPQRSSVNDSYLHINNSFCSCIIYE